MNSASCQCIHNSTIAVPTTLSTATMNLLVVWLTKVSIVSRSVTRCDATVLLPRVSYSAIEKRSRRCSRVRRIL